MKTKRQKKAVVGYVRTATTSQAKDNISVNTQEKQIKKYCKAKGYKLTKVFSDNGCSGTNLQRPGIQQLLAEVSTGKISKIVCLDADRLSRNRVDFIYLTYLFKANEVKAIFLSGTSAGEDIRTKLFEEIQEVTDHLYLNRRASKRKRCCDGSCDPVYVNRRKV